MNKKLLAKYREYKVTCDGKYHYFTSKKLKEVKAEKCKCKK